MHEPSVTTTQGAHAEMVRCANFVDSENRPAGGTATAVGLTVVFQDGPMGDGREHNGCFVEDLLIVAAERMRFYQAGQFAGAENAAALLKIESALDMLNARTMDRQKRKVEGKHQA